jgi:hypothetical protein
MGKTITLDESQLDAFLEQRLAALGVTTKTVSSTPSYQPAHGPGGTFSAPGADPNVFNAMLMPLTGVEDMLPEYATNEVLPIYDIVTGQTAATGSEPGQACADWPEAGLLKLCGQVGVMDMFGRQSKVLNLATIGQKRDRADFMDYQLVNDPWSASGGRSSDFLNAKAGGPSDALNDDMSKAMRELVNEYRRARARDIWEANPTNNPAPGNGRQYYRGFDLLINTGYQDYIQQQACPAADSVVANFQNLNIGTGTNGASLVATISSIWYYLNRKADENGMAPVKWIIAMHPELFHEVTAIWPCTYLTARCVMPTGGAVQLDARDQTNMRDAMRKGRYLEIEGEMVQVVPDSTIRRTDVGGAFRSKIYFIPLTGRAGAIPITFKRYFDYSNDAAAKGVLARLGSLAGMFDVSDNGKFLWSFDKNNTCIQIQAIGRRTLVLRAPYLAASISNILYSPVRAEASWDPADPYFQNGGVTSRPQPFYYPPSA